MILAEVMLITTQLHLKKFYNFGTSGQYYKTFLGVINATISVFPYDFDWGYAKNNVITSKKVL
jgi:hypothetical protein